MPIRYQSFMNDDILQRLQRLDACAVSDALDRLGIAGQVSTGLSRQATDRRVCGRAVTYRLVPAGQAAPKPGPVRHLGTTAIELARPGDVIVVEQRTGIDAGSWGGILSLAASVKGIAGVVADGPVRDIEEARAYDLPVWCRSLTARTARGRVEEDTVNEPVCVDGVTVAPGDLVIADASGIAFIPAARAEEVVAAAEMIAGREAAMAKDLLAGLPVTQVMGKSYEHMLRPDAA
jgi:4-hydroxy-4-methyl-2-oxoglutarate aldolase